jgi:hypothetical protein
VQHRVLSGQPLVLAGAPKQSTMQLSNQACLEDKMLVEKCTVISMCQTRKALLRSIASTILFPSYQSHRLVKMLQHRQSHPFQNQHKGQQDG